MKKIVLLCAGGISTAVLVKKLRKEAASIGYECDINAYGVNKANEVGKDADVVLLGPQIRFNDDAVRKQVSCPVEAIEPRAYGTQNAKAVLQRARELMGDL